MVVEEEEGEAKRATAATTDGLLLQGVRSIEDIEKSKSDDARKEIGR